MSTRTLLTAAALMALMAGGCAGATDRSGGTAAPTTVVLASNDGSETRAALTRFVDRVAEVSDGRVRVQVSSQWRTKGEQRVLEDVASGEVPLGWSGTRAFDTVGVDAFRPLHAPFLVGTYPAQRAVVSGLAPDFLGSLKGTGMTGLAVLADELRVPAGAEHPLLTPEDFKNLTFAFMASNEQSAGVTALGARPRAMVVPNTSSIEGLGGLETQWSTYVSNGQQRVVPFVTANAGLWPRTTALVANTHWFDAQEPAVRDALTKAASDAQSWSLDNAEADIAREMAQACTGGAKIALASDSQLTALRRAAEPAYTAMRAKPAQGALLARVEQLVANAERPPAISVPSGCAYTPGDKNPLAIRDLPAPLPGPGRAGTLPAGTYRYTLTEKELRNALPSGGEMWARANAGVWTWTLKGGQWSYLLRPTAQNVPDGFAGNRCEGYYDVHGDKVDFTTVTAYASGDCASQTFKATWRKSGRDLVLDVTTDADDLDFLFGAKTWHRIS
jgi:TRAP-type C4-dicarboxylate transport system substrate-binding protein